MPKNTRVLHVVKGFTMPMRQVIKRIEDNCSFVWVEYGKTFRDATPQEALRMRNEQVQQETGLYYWIEGRDREGKPCMIAKPYFAELPDCIFQHGDGAQIRMETRLAAQANRFAAEATL